LGAFAADIGVSQSEELDVLAAICEFESVLIA
jgi:hypothetical protein